MQRQKGFSLIEVLITMLLVSVGLLGIAAIIITNMKNFQSAYARGQATILVQDIVDRMRANRAEAESVTSPYTIALTAPAAGGASVAASDLKEWRDAVAAAVPSGTGSVEFEAGTNNVTVTVQWDDSRGKGDGGVSTGLSAQKFTLETHL